MKKEKVELRIIPLDDVKQLLKGDFYGVSDLIDLDLFPSDYTVRVAMQEGQVTFQKVNKNNIFFTRDALIDYWEKYRGEPKPPVDQQLQFKLTVDEKEALDRIIATAKDKVGEQFTVEDLFRNIIQYLGGEHSRGAIDYNKGHIFKINT